MKRCIEASGQQLGGVKGSGSKRNVHLRLKRVRFLICEWEKGQGRGHQA